jgi:hypothetical protein
LVGSFKSKGFAPGFCFRDFARGGDVQGLLPRLVYIFEWRAAMGIPTNPRSQSAKL